jgi:hypothetical protein
MKITLRNFAWKTGIVWAFLMLVQIVMWGQDSTGTSSSSTRTTTTTTTRTEWYTAPWVWVVGGAVLLLLLVALLSGGRRSSRTTVTRSTDYGTGSSTKVVAREVDED